MVRTRQVVRIHPVALRPHSSNWQSKPLVRVRLVVRIHLWAPFLVLSFSGRTRGCQPHNGGSIPPGTAYVYQELGWFSIGLPCRSPRVRSPSGTPPFPESSFGRA